ncbi:PKD domain-containing protein [Halorubrum ejinorense]|uniref:PKD domain-containing protein n=1 Tax=Halorubrum ejinorense TaxID=425309 RepID=A0AAV3SS06_9EURY
MDRRTYLRASIGAGIASSVTVGAIPESVTAEPSGSLTINDQTLSDGQSLVIGEIETQQDANLGIRNQRTDSRLYSSSIEAGVYEDYEVRIAPPITEESRVSVSLYPEDGGSSFARDTAIVSGNDDLEIVDGIDQTLVAADSTAGFEYPFFLYAPSNATSGEGKPAPVLVEPANSGQPADDIDVHISAGERLVSDGLPRDISERLGAPLIVPVFPRPESDPVNWRHLTHALDDTTMGIEDGSLERIDLQVLNMVERAYEILEDAEYAVRTDGILLNGFSASGNFVDRFTVLHPDEVISVTAGGLNGMPLLPLDKFKGRELPFHVGTADLEALTGSPVDRETLDETNQFLYMGAEDNNDTIGFGDAWTEDSLEELALDVYGEDMIVDRFPTSQSAYEKAGVSAQFRVYPDAGHTARPAAHDIVEFHQRSIDGEDVSVFGDEIGTTLRIDLSPENPEVGDEVTFDASESSTVAGREFLSYQWEFGDGDVGIEETTTHSYANEGEFTVTLATTSDLGERDEVTIQVGVGEGYETIEDTDDSDDNETEPNSDGVDDNGPADTNDDDVGTESNSDETDDTDPAATDKNGETGSNTDGADGDDSEDTNDDVPGFGVSGALAGVGGLVYLLKHRLSGTKSESS